MALLQEVVCELGGYTTPISTDTQATRCKYTLPGIDDLLSEVRENGAGSYIWKSDMSRAYRQVRLDPLMGIKHRKRYYIDICPSFGCRTSGSACQRTTSAIAEELRNEGFHCIVYVDNFCGAAPTREIFIAAYKCLHNTAARLGIELATEKDVPPTTYLDFLGFEVNTQSMEVKIPQKKLDEIVEECLTWRHIQRFFLFYWGLTPQQQPGSYQGGAHTMDIKEKA